MKLFADVKKAFSGLKEFSPDQQLIFNKDILNKTYNRTSVILVIVLLIQILNLITHEVYNTHPQYGSIYQSATIGLIVICLLFLIFFICFKKVSTKIYKTYSLLVKSFWVFLMAGMIAFSFAELLESCTIVNFTLYILALGIIPLIGMVEILVLILIFLIPNIIFGIYINMPTDVMLLMVVLAILSFYAALVQYSFAFEVFVEKQNLAKTNKKLELLSETDQLTCIFNRRGMVKQLYRLKFDSEENIQLSMLLLDVDFFKEYNDKYYHLKGDQCLIKIADCLKANRYYQDDIIVRYGGEEFLIISRIDNNEFVNYALKIKTAINELHIPFDKNEFFPYITVSIGLASDKFERKTDSINNFINDLINQADMELYYAKSNGRNCVSHKHMVYR